jgi:hypothetical protein
MKPKLLLFVAIAGLVGSSNCSVVYAQRGGGQDPGGNGPASDTKSAPTPRTRWQKPLSLPEQYRSKDKDKDGQIGMYEWPRNDLAAFRKLDLNHDGFLTAAELTRGSSSKSAPPVAAAPPPANRPAPSGSSAAPAAAKTGAEPGAKAADAASDEGEDDADEPAAPAKENPATETPAPSNAGRSEAERQWEIVDKDKDGKVMEEEWGRSYLARPKFRDAGIAVSFPMSKEEFLRLYAQLPGSGK